MFDDDEENVYSAVQSGQVLVCFAALLCLTQL